jgi:UDP-N-acetylmuramoylalanine--D-glutamate ligase
MNLSGAIVVVVGMAKSGQAAVDLLLDKGAQVRAVDEKPVTGLRVPVLPQTPESFAGADLVVLSPGVPADLDVLRGQRVIGELELASWFLRGPTIAITGSNGKTTTTALTGHILAQCGIASQVGGNIGTPPTSMIAASRDAQWNVLEVSSFQLETTQSFHPNIAAVLNITPNHLDRHHTFENYVAAKARIFQNQVRGDLLILNGDDPVTRSFASQAPSNVVFFGARPCRPCAWMDEQLVTIDGDPLMEISDIPLRGRHNVENVMAAALAANLAHASLEGIAAAVKTFPGVPHRLEFVSEIKGVSYYNDSKATSVDATLKALATFDGGLWVILGGKDKGSPYTPLIEPLKAKAHAVLLIGAAAPKIAAELSEATTLIPCGTLEVAVREASERARPGDTVLLAPACASFDQFESFEHRGKEFKRLVGQLWRG